MAVIRTIGVARATAKITLANLAYNMRRLVWMDGRPAPAWPIAGPGRTDLCRTSQFLPHYAASALTGRRFHLAAPHPTKLFEVSSCCS